jgi:AcrR family transcriptional regulator
VTRQDASASTRPPRADAVRNRARVLAAASEAFAAEGLAVPLDEIARRAGVGAGTVYRHFPTKEALFEAVITDRLLTLAADAEARLASAADPGEAFFEFFAGTIDTGLAKTDLAEALTSAGRALGAELQQAAERLQNGFEALLKRAQEAGAVRTDISVHDLHALAKGAIAAEKRAETDPSIESGKMTRVICDGLRA